MEANLPEDAQDLLDLGQNCFANPLVVGWSADAHKMHDPDSGPAFASNMHDKSGSLKHHSFQFPRTLSCHGNQLAYHESVS